VENVWAVPLQSPHAPSYVISDCVGYVWVAFGGAQDCAGGGREEVGGLREYSYRAGGVVLLVEGEGGDGAGVFAGYEDGSAVVKLLEEEVLRLHSYETPEFLVMEIAAGADGYVEWLGKSVK